MARLKISERRLNQTLEDDCGVDVKIAGRCIKISLCDKERVLAHKWTFHQSIHGSFQILAWIRKNQQRQRITLQRFILSNLATRFVTQRPDADRFDFRRSALMTCEERAHVQNALPKRNIKSSSRFKGVSYSKKTGRWRASIRPKGKSIYLGEFVTEKEAAIAYNKAALIHFGPNAYFNEV